MKKLLVIAFCTLGFWQLGAQSIPCEPDTSLADTAFGVFPLPFSEDNPMGGISDTACLNSPFSVTFTVKVPGTFEVPTLGAVEIDSIGMDTANAVSNLPEGIDYRCNPPNCVFAADTSGCIQLQGTPTSADDVGATDLQISGLLYSFIAIEVSFPDSMLFAPGNYRLFLRDENDPFCSPLSTSEPFANKLQLQNRPNPFSGFTDIEINSKLNGDFEFQVYNLLGEQQHRRRINLIRGNNRIRFDGSQLAAGLYIYLITDGFNAVSDKMMIQRR